MLSVDIDTADAFMVGAPIVLFNGLRPPSCNWRDYDVFPDGQRFLFLESPVGGGGSQASDIVLVQNWFEELKRLVPAE